MKNIIEKNSTLSATCSMEKLLSTNDAWWAARNPTELQVREASVKYEISQESTVLQEVQVFRKFNANSIDFVVEDDGLAPQFKAGDHVAGVMRFYDDIQHLIGYNCIVQLSNRKLLLRYIKSSNTPNYFDLICTNAKTSIAKPTLYRQRLIFAAPVIWHRRHNEQWH